MLAEALFIISVGILAYIYIGYPMLINVLSLFFGRDVRMAKCMPRVSIVVAARNEENDIAAKIENTLALEYPHERLEIIVASDCSTDHTDAIVGSFADRGVVLRRASVRLGKTAAQNQAVQASVGDILVFSDATTRLGRNALNRIVRSFADPEVGCVTGQLVYVDKDPLGSGVGSGCRTYWNWEKRIRQSESRLGSLIGVSGCFYAVRRSCYPRLSGEMIDDFVIASEIHLQGLRTVYDPEAVAMEYTNRSASDEFRMRVRVVEQSMNALSRYWKRLRGKWDMFKLQLVSHKLMRYLAPCVLLTAYISNLFLTGQNVVYTLSLGGMTSFYVLALAGWWMDRTDRRLGPLTVPYYFVLANAAAAVALMKFIRGDSHVMWEPVREETEPTAHLRDTDLCVESRDL